MRYSDTIVLSKGEDVYDWIKDGVLPPLTAQAHYHGQRLPLEDQYYTEELVDYRAAPLQIRQLRTVESKSSSIVDPATS